MNSGPQQGCYLNPVPTYHLPPLSTALLHLWNTGPTEKLRHHPFQSNHFTNGANDLSAKWYNQLLELHRHRIRIQTHLSAVQCFFHVTMASDMSLKVTFRTETVWKIRYRNNSHHVSILIKNINMHMNKHSHTLLLILGMTQTGIWNWSLANERQLKGKDLMIEIVYSWP